MSDAATPTAGPASEGNWGRWGPDDERGALNLIDPDAVLRALQTSKTGRVYNLGLPVQREGVPIFDYRGAPQRLTLTGQTDYSRIAEYGAEPGSGANEDLLILPVHNGTHMDALSHVFFEDSLYNGHPESSFSSYAGASRCGIDKTGGVVARAVLLDLPRFEGTPWLEPGRLISGDDLEAVRASQGVSIGAGDVLLIRTGWLDLFAALEPGQEPPMAQPGIGMSALPFIRDHDISVVGSDNGAIEVIPFDTGRFLSVHIELLVKSGIHLLEHLVLSELAGDDVHEALFVAAPLQVTGGTGSPVNPLAIA